MDIQSVTPRELQVIELLIEGKINKIIAKELGISEGTVKNHLWNIMRKFECDTRLQVALKYSYLKQAGANI